MSTSRPQQATALLFAASRQWRRRRAFEAGGRFALLAALVSVPFVLIAVLLQATWAMTALLIALSAIAGIALMAAVVAWLLPVDRLRAARAIDAGAHSDDRFASALQLARHPHADRAALILDDAIDHVGHASPAAAIPVRWTPEWRWLPAPVALLIGFFWLLPSAQVSADDSSPDVSAEQWAALQDDFQEELSQLPEPQSEDERDLRERLEKLAEMLEEKPDKKEMLAEIARLRAELEKRQNESGLRDPELRQAARNMNRSEALNEFGNQLRAGNYQQAAAELNKLAEQLKSIEAQLTAEQLEAAAADMDQLAQMIKHQQLQQAAQACAAAANSMNQSKLSEELQKLSQCMSNNADALKKCDSLCNARSMLDELKRRLSRCQGGKCSQCKSGKCAGQCSAYADRSDKKGGLRAGWGTASQWEGGALADGDEQRMPDLTELRESSGASTSFSTISPDERAQSSQTYNEMYAEFVRKAEADLALEDVPLAYRDYLRRYFVSIRPTDSPDESSAATPDAE